jgi:hypothetical protein
MERDFLTIVSGLPRSGTSMMMRMIDEGGIPALTDNIRKADIDNPNGYYEFEPVKRTKHDPSWLEDAPGKVVKMVHLLLLDLPKGHEYRVIFMRRKLEEVVRSQNVMLEHKGKAGQTLRDEQVMALFRQQIKQVDDYMLANPNFKCLQVDYNQMLANPKPWVHHLNEFLGGGLNTARMLEVVDPTLYRQRA